MGGGDVEKAELICPCGIIGDGGIHRITRIAQVDEVDALDHAAVGHVKTGDDAGLQHVGGVAGGAFRGKTNAASRATSGRAGSASACKALRRSMAPS